MLNMYTTVKHRVTHKVRVSDHKKINRRCNSPVRTIRSCHALIAVLKYVKESMQAWIDMHNMDTWVKH